MTSHTPGPWTLNGEIRRIGGTEHYCADICGTNDGGFWRGSVAYIQTADHLKRGMRIDEGKANARLIAAAPDMLEALRQMVVNSEGDGKEYRDCHKKALAAIAKATGAA